MNGNLIAGAVVAVGLLAYLPVALSMELQRFRAKKENRYSTRSSDIFII